MNAVIYARYSSHSQTDQSIEGQLKENHEFAVREGYAVVGEYIDRAQSARTDNREAFQRMVADAAKNQFQFVIVWKLDRFARNRYDSAIYKARLKKYGVRVISATETISENPEGIILEGMLESMAEFYSANLSKNIRRGQSVSISKGKFCGGNVPYGYKSAGGKLVADELTAPVIRYVFDQYAQGVPKRTIFADLSARGVKNRSGGELGKSSFQNALKNPVYIGKYTYNGETVPGLADPLIDTETFEKVQIRLKSVYRARASGKAPEEYLLQGKAFCGHCGSPMIGDSGKGKAGAIYRYYACSARKNVKKCARICDKKSEKKDFAEWYVVEQTQEYVLTPSRIASIAAAVVGEYQKDFSVSAEAELIRAVSRLDRKLNVLVDALSESPKSAHSRIYTQMETLEAQLSDAKSDLAKLRIAQGIRFTEAEVTAWLRQFCGGDPLDPEFRRRIISVFINSVYFYDNRIAIFYNIRGGKQVSYLDLQSALGPAPYPTSSPPPSASLLQCSSIDPLGVPRKTR